jgi:hypothetical protein
MKTRLFRALSGLLLVCTTVLVSANTDAAQRTVSQMMDCDIKVKGVFSGTPVNVVITVYDVSWGECLLLRTAVALSAPKK